MRILSPGFTRRHVLAWGAGVFASRWRPALALEAAAIPAQPYFAGVNRALMALAKLGAPATPQDAARISDLSRQGDDAAVAEAERILARYTLAQVTLDADGYALTLAGAAEPVLLEQGWRVFLVRVSNPLASHDRLNAAVGGGPSIATIASTSTGAARAGVSDTLNMAPFIANNWLLSQLYEADPMTTSLSGFPLEYRVIQLYSRDRGAHSSEFVFATVTDTDRHKAFFARTSHRIARLSFNCLPSNDVALRVVDSDGRGCMASLTIKDRIERVYPLQAMRLAPDMQFHPQIYRADGENVRLPDGVYQVESRRGPEYLRTVQSVTIDGDHRRIDVQLRRWIDPAQWGWYSGDTHIHAGGCSHYEHPTEGVSPETMIRHVRGEALSIGDVLSWGPSWYYQKQFFSGHTVSPAASLEHPELQVANNANLQTHATPEDAESMLRYDVEISGFPSSACGHLVLLRVKEQDYPGTSMIQEWPSWNLPILQWARAQGAVAGYAHCGIGMIVESTDIPNYEIPPMDGIGTQEAIIDVTHGLVDFLSGCNTPPAAELNAWYHMLNCGYRLAMVGETDYPCISGERPGVGRSYVRLERRPTQDVDYEGWIQGLKRGRLYCGDGRSHFLDFKVNGRRSGEADLSLNTPGTVAVEALVAAHLDPEPPADIDAIRHMYLNGWHIENARIGATRTIAVELVINSLPVEKSTLLADGTPRTIRFRAPVDRSSWIALRILPSAHTHPIFVLIGDKPIRASRRSAQWCRDCVDKVWEVKSPFMRDSERPAAALAFDHARNAYDTIAGECEVA